MQRKIDGNGPRFDLKCVEKLKDSRLKNKRIIFLGSSVTYGAAAMGVSFVDYIGERHSADVLKEAVSGTTLVYEGEDSYIERLKKINREEADLFICQLSTNDATQNKPLGLVGASFEPGDFDTKTIAGAIEYIICYAKERWHCPIGFYTNPRFDSEFYGEMVKLLYEIAEKWGISVIDLWGNKEFNDVSVAEYLIYMADSIHPTKAGYMNWWTPFIEKKLIEMLGPVCESTEE